MIADLSNFCLVRLAFELGTHGFVSAAGERANLGDFGAILSSLIESLLAGGAAGAIVAFLAKRWLARDLERFKFELGWQIKGFERTAEAIEKLKSVAVRAFDAVDDSLDSPADAALVEKAQTALEAFSQVRRRHTHTLKLPDSNLADEASTTITMLGFCVMDVRAFQKDESAHERVDKAKANRKSAEEAWNVFDDAATAFLAGRGRRSGR